MFKLNGKYEPKSQEALKEFKNVDFINVRILELINGEWPVKVTSLNWNGSVIELVTDKGVHITSKMADGTTEPVLISCLGEYKFFREVGESEIKEPTPRNINAKISVEVTQDNYKEVIELINKVFTNV